MDYNVIPNCFAPFKNSFITIDFYFNPGFVSYGASDYYFAVDKNLISYLDVMFKVALLI